MSANRGEKHDPPRPGSFDGMPNGRSRLVRLRKSWFRIEVWRRHQEDAFGAVKGFGETSCILNTGDSDITALSGPGTSLLGIPHHRSHLLSLCQKTASYRSAYLACYSSNCKHNRPLRKFC